MVFQKKKVRMETLSEYLREVRKQLGLSVKQVSGKSGVAQKFIQALESGEFSQLPPDVYVLGFLNQLAETYSVPTDVLVKQFKKERGIAEQVATPAKARPTRSSRILNSIVVTPKLLSLAVGGLVLLVIVLYIIYELVSLSSAPSLTVSEPQDGQIVQSGSVAVAGKTDPGATLTINGKIIALDKDGTFKTTVAVAGGSQELDIAAQSKFSKTTTKTIKITSEAPSDNASGQATSAQITLQLDFIGTTALTLKVDGTDVPTEIQGAGGSKTVTAQSEIILSASDGGSIKASLNGQTLGVLGKKGEALNNVSFTADMARSLAPTPKK